MALKAERLEALLLPGEGLPHRHDVVELRAPGADRLPAGGALASLLGQQQLLLPLARGDPRRLDQRGESLEAQRGQPLPAVVQPQRLGPRLQQLPVLGQLTGVLLRSRSKERGFRRDKSPRLRRPSPAGRGPRGPTRACLPMIQTCRASTRAWHLQPAKVLGLRVLFP